MGLLTGGLAQTIHSAMKGLFLDAVLLRDVPGVSSDPADPSPPVRSSYPCKAIADTYSSFDVASGLADSTDAKILILSKSLSFRPVAGDKISLNGGKPLSIVRVTTDPAMAVWECQAKV